MFRLYVSLVRPHLDYSAAPALNPNLTKDVRSLEYVHVFALKVCLKQWNTSYCQLLNQSHLPDLSTRRKHLSLSYFYNIIKGIHVFHALPLVPHSSDHFLHNTHSLMNFNYHTNYFHYSFFPHVTVLWNIWLT